MNLKSLYSGSNMDHFERPPAVRLDTLVCATCGVTGRHGKQPGSGWRNSHSAMCHSCDGEVIEIASPRGRKIVGEALSQQTAEQCRTI